MPTGWPQRLMARTLLGVALGLPAAGALVVAGPTTNAGASVSIPVPFDDLVRRSVAAVVVTPLSERCDWIEGRIVTFTELRVDLLLAGDVGVTDEPIWVETLGGVVEHVGQSVEGEASFRLGRPSLLFLRPPPDPLRGAQERAFVVTARAQGQFAVVRDAQDDARLRRSGGVGGMLAPAGAHVSEAPLASDVLHGGKLTDATATIRGAWGRLHAP
jgi:hypothetical protein